SNTSVSKQTLIISPSKRSSRRRRWSQVGRWASTGHPPAFAAGADGASLDGMSDTTSSELVTLAVDIVTGGMATRVRKALTLVGIETGAQLSERLAKECDAEFNEWVADSIPKMQAQLDRLEEALAKLQDGMAADA